MDSDLHKTRETVGNIQRTKKEIDKTNITTIDVDVVWTFLHRFGKYQILQIIILWLTCIPMSTAILSGVFVGKEVIPACRLGNSSNVTSDNVSIIATQCHIRYVLDIANETHVISEEKCSQFDYEGDVYTSFIAEWDLVCDNEGLSQLPQMLTMIGMTVGASTLPQLGDRYGRKKLIVGSHLLMLAVSIGMAYAPAFELFLFFKFLSGSFNQGFMVPSYTASVELFTTELRSSVGFCSTIIWVLSLLTLIPIGYFLQNHSWRTMQLAYALMSVVVVAYIFLDESLRWLVANKKVDQAKAQLEKACRMNGKRYDDLLDTVLYRRKKPRTKDPVTTEAQEPLSPMLFEEENMNTGTTQATLWDMMKNKRLRAVSFIICYSWMVNSLTYYGITLLSTSLAGNPYINFAIGAVLEFPSTLVMLLIMNKFGRKMTLILSTGAAGICLLVVVLVITLAGESYAVSMIQTSLTLLGKFCISSSFNAVWIYTPELYPTNLRNVGIGLSSTCARIAATASPFITILGRQALWAPGAVFSAACFVNVFLLTYMPETGWRELPQTIEDIEAWFDKPNKKGRPWDTEIIIKGNSSPAKKRERVV